MRTVKKANIHEPAQSPSTIKRIAVAAGCALVFAVSPLLDGCRSTDPPQRAALVPTAPPVPERQQQPSAPAMTDEEIVAQFREQQAAEMESRMLDRKAEMLNSFRENMANPETRFTALTNLQHQIRYQCWYDHAALIPELTETVRGRDRELRWLAMEALGEIGDNARRCGWQYDWANAIDAIKWVLKNDREADDYRDELFAHTGRSKAAETLGRIGDTSALPDLLRAFWNAAGANMRNRIMRSIVDIAEAHPEYDWSQYSSRLADMLRNSNPRMHDSVIDALGNMGHVAAVQALTEVLQDDHSEWGAYNALIKIVKKNPGYEWDETARAMLEIFRETHEQQAVLVLMEIDNTGRYGWIADEMISIAKQSNWAPLKIDVFLRVMGKHPEYRTVLVPELAGMANDDYAPDLSDAVEEFPWFDWKEVVPAFVAKIKTGDSIMRSSFMRALGDMGNASAAPALAENMADANENVRLAAVHALGDIARKNPWIYWGNTVDVLIAALGDENIDVRNAAAYALGQTGDERAYAPLTELKRSGREGHESAEIALIYLSQKLREQREAEHEWREGRGF